MHNETINILDFGAGSAINQSKKRIKYYKKCDYNICYIKCENTINNELNEIKLQGKCYIK